ncbi:ASCH domain-containing protein [Brucella sp. HL-2]|nr:ASCH domain-containing protein [Brucella sp. HL-2]MCV9910226.1 ASCH domain-containing protein [Brucella sp. HL-2]
MLFRPDLPKLAISVRQPWAFAIVHLEKDIENREWQRDFRGPVAIHASGSVGTKADYSEAKDDVSAILATRADNRLLKWQEALDNQAILARGGIIGTAEIVGCVAQSESTWFFGTYGFVLKNAQPVDFIPVKGALGFFDWRENLTSVPL